MTGVFVNPTLLHPGHGQHADDDIGERGRIVDSEFIIHGARTHRYKLFDQQAIFCAAVSHATGAKTANQAGKVGALYHQRIADKIAAGISGPEAYSVVERRFFLQGHDTGIPPHLGKDHHVVGILDYLQIIVIGSTRQGRTGIEHQTTFRQPAIFRPGSIEAAMGIADGSARRDFLHSVRVAALHDDAILHCRQTPIGRIHQHRCSAVASQRRPFHPETVD